MKNIIRMQHLNQLALSRTTNGKGSDDQPGALSVLDVGAFLPCHLGVSETI